MTTEPPLEITNDYIATQKVRAAACDEVTLPGDCFRSLLAEIKRLKCSEIEAQLTVKIYANDVLMGWTTNEKVWVVAMNDIIERRSKTK